MVPDAVPEIEYVALLSAASVADADGHKGALQAVAGQPLLENQMHALHRHGVASFLIEVDTVPGELLNLADRFRTNGARVEFVRSAKDLKNFLKANQKLIIQAEAHYFSQALVDELIVASPPFVATLDGRAENAQFERIDLNTRWAGFAFVEADMALSLGELPEGWSIGSSLLRLAIQHGVRFEPVAQAHLQNVDLLRVSGAADAEQIVNMMLAARCDKPNGSLERQVFGKLARLVVPSIWRSPNGGTIIVAAHLAGAAASVGFALLGWNLMAASVAMVSVCLNSVFQVVQGIDGETNSHRWQPILFWAMIVAAAFFIARSNAVYGSDAPFFVLIMAGLAMLSFKIALPRWAKPVLQSPALLVLIMVIGNMTSIFGTSLKWILLAQLGVLLAAVYLPVDRARNSNHP
jgi:hypothetical protein